jgi:beta-glucosidase
MYRRPHSTLSTRSVATSIALLALGCGKHFPVSEAATPNAVAAKAPDARCLAPEKPMAAITGGTAATGNMPSSACVDKARQIVAKLTLRQKLGQMMQPDRGNVRSLDELRQHGYGSILSGGGSAPTTGNEATDWSDMIAEYRLASLENPAAIPVVYGIDAVHGNNNVHGAVIFPHNIGLGASRDPDLVERIGRATAREVRATQIDWTFAPVVTAARDERWGRTYEAYGETQELAELLGPALVRGLQTDNLAGPHAVLATAKHFVGDGYTSGGVDQGNSLLTLEQVRRDLMPAYKKVIEAGVGSVMTSYSSIDGAKMHCHGPLMNDTLKTDLGFQGFIVSDWKAIEKLPGTYGEQLTASINAGLDMVMAPEKHTGLLDELEKLVPSKIPMARIDDAVTRILAIKCALGMFDEGRYARDRGGRLSPEGELVTAFGGEAHRKVAREAVQKSLVLLKNDNQALPLTPPAAPAPLYVTGSGANDIGRQCGGWTISWQGQNGDAVPGTTLVEGLTASFGPDAIQTSPHYDAAMAARASTAVVVASEVPYAEMKGDDQDLELPDEDIADIEALHKAGKRVVLVLFSGRPMIVTPVLDKVDAFVAAWLPGTEGAGIVDVLLGANDFVGVLPHSWPRSIDQVPINVGDAEYSPLFPYGFGLKYQSAAPAVGAH